MSVISIVRRNWALNRTEYFSKSFSVLVENKGEALILEELPQTKSVFPTDVGTLPLKTKLIQALPRGSDAGWWCKDSNNRTFGLFHLFRRRSWTRTTNLQGSIKGQICLVFSWKPKTLFSSLAAVLIQELWCYGSKNITPITEQVKKYDQNRLQKYLHTI